VARSRISCRPGGGPKLVPPNEFRAGIERRYHRSVGRVQHLVLRAVRLARSRAGVIDLFVAILLSVVTLGHMSRPASAALVPLAVACALATTTSVAWRSRAPVMAVAVAGAGLVGYGWLTRSHSLLPGGVLALPLAMYSAGARGMSRRRCLELAGLIAYGSVCVLMDAPMARVPGSVAAGWVAPVAFTAGVGFLVARQRSLGGHLAAAIDDLQAAEKTRLAVATARERNRVARDLHDVVTHGVSVMVIQAGAARITADAESDLAVAALGEVTAAGRSATDELRRIIGTMTSGNDDAHWQPSGLAAVAALGERCRAGGLPVLTTVAGHQRGLPPAVDAALYRLVQESLTNVVKHAPGAATTVDLAFKADAIEITVANSAPAGPPVPVGGTGRGHGLTGMRERVESCGGQLWHESRPGGGFEVRAWLPFASPDAEDRHPFAGMTARLIHGLRRLGAWPGVIVALGVLCGEAFLSPDRRGSLVLNEGLCAAMALTLPWRRRSPLTFLIVVNLLAFPISNGLTSISNFTLADTFVFVVPIWAVAAWSELPTAVAGLLVTVGFQIAEALHWHLAGSSVPANALPAAFLWVAARVMRSQRRLAGDLARTLALVEAAQQEREQLALAVARAQIVAGLHSAVAEQVQAMTDLAQSARQAIESDPAGAVASISRIERTGRDALARLREILGLLRADYDPGLRSSLLGVEQFRDLVNQHCGKGSPARLSVSGVPAPLLGGVDVLTYRIIEGVLGAASCRAVGLHFDDRTLGVNFMLADRRTSLPDPTTRTEIERLGGSIHRAAVGPDEQVTVQLPLVALAVS
jgi:signal transduction histidine kinase